MIIPTKCKYLTYYMINKIKKDKKIKFINVDNLTISKQRVVFSENSLLLDFKEAANIQKVKEGFF